MNLKDVSTKLNGKKRYVAGGVSAAITIPFLISFLINTNTTVTANETQLKVNTKVVEQLSMLPARMTGVEVSQVAFKEKLDESIERQETVNGRILGKLDRLLAK